MKSILDRALADELKARVAHLRTNPAPQWGKMTAAQAAAHCSIALEMARGERKLPRVLIGRLFGRLVKPMVLKDDAPMQRNAPTSPEMKIVDDRNLDAECARLVEQIERVASGGPRGITTNPHPFFGDLTPEEWGILQYKHVDHHLRQFGA